MEKSKENEHRRQKRWHLIYYLKVHNKATGELLGHMADITSRGIMLVSDKPVEDNQKFELTLELPENFQKDLKEISFEAESHWHQKDINPQYYANGFKITHMSDQNQEIVKELIRRYFFNE